MTGRNLRLEELGWSAKLLSNTTALVVGAGAIGNEVIKNASLVGFGQLVVVDMDRIEDHNLTRTVLFRSNDVGELKAEVACRRAKELNEDLRALAICEPIQAALGLGAYPHFDVVFGCVDNLGTRRDLNRACFATGTLYIDGGLRQLDGEVRCFAPPFDVCFDCTLSKEMREHAQERAHCLQIPTGSDNELRATAPTNASLVGGLMVQLAVKHVHGMGIPVGEAVGYLGTIDDPFRMRWQRNPQCPTHEDIQPVDSAPILKLDRRSDEMTLSELVAVVRNELGPDAVLRTPFELVEALVCRRCESRQVVRKHRHLVTLDHAVCRTCQASTGDPLSDLVRSLQERFEFTGDEPYAGEPLSDIGFRPLDIYTGSRAGEQLLVELTGDEHLLQIESSDADRDPADRTPTATTARRRP